VNPQNARCNNKDSSLIQINTNIFSRNTNNSIRSVQFLIGARFSEHEKLIVIFFSMEKQMLYFGMIICSLSDTHQILGGISCLFWARTGEGRFFGSLLSIFHTTRPDIQKKFQLYFHRNFFVQVHCSQTFSIQTAY
jgi:hypothetical protein